MSGVGDLGDKLSNFVKYGFEDLNGDNVTKTDGTEGVVSLNGIIQFKDGTQQSIEPEGLTFTLFPLTVFFEDKEIERIKWYLGATITWSGDLEDLDISACMGCWEEDLLIDKHDFVKHYEGNVITKEEWFPIHELMLTAKDIELILPEGDHTLIVTTKHLTFRATFESGHIEEQILAEGDNPRWEIQLKIEAETMTVLSASIDMGLYPS